MADKRPLKVILTGTTPTAIGEFVTGDTIGVGQGGTGQTTVTAAFNALAPLAGKGDILYHDGARAARLAPDANGKVLMLSASLPSWQPAGTPDAHAASHEVGGADVVHVTGTMIGAGVIVNSMLAASAVTATKIAAGAVTTSKLGAGAVTATKIAGSAVTTAKINNGAVTTTKIAASGTGGQILGGVTGTCPAWKKGYIPFVNSSAVAKPIAITISA
jgi:hypothetical protein